MRPSKDLRVLILIFVVAVVGGGFGSFVFPKRSKTDQVVVRLPNKERYILGNHTKNKDRVTLIEFIDYQCPPCRMTHAEVIKFVNARKVNMDLTVRNYPLKMHPYAMDLAIGVEAAREQGKFKEMKDAVLSSDNLKKEYLVRMATKLGMNLQKFNLAILTSAKASVTQDMDDAERLGLSGTPSFYLSDKHDAVWSLRDYKLSDQFKGSKN